MGCQEFEPITALLAVPVTLVVWCALWITVGFVRGLWRARKR